MSNPSSPSSPRSLSQILAECNPVSGKLPLVHVTKSEFMNSIIHEGSLSTRVCRFFNEELIYFFYGRPSYRIGSPEKPTTQLLHFPVCFVFKPDAEIGSGISRVYPFDSGAGMSNFFSPDVIEGDLQHFELNPTIDSAQRTVAYFFHSNERYFNGEAKEGLLFTETDAIAERYYRLVRHAGEERYDDRRSSIEVQFKSRLTLEENLMAVVLPRGLLDAPGVLEAIHQWKALPIVYCSVWGTIPSEYTAVIREKLANLFTEKGYL